MQTAKETIEWRIIAIIITFIITYAWTGKLIEAASLTIVLNLTKSLVYYFWRKIKLGDINRKNIQPKATLKATYDSWINLRKGHGKDYKIKEI